jgi:hypothetical protein
VPRSRVLKGSGGKKGNSTKNGEAMHHDPAEFLRISRMELPLIGLYDAPDKGPFEPVIEPKPGSHVCVFAFFRSWLKGRTAALSKETFGCRGLGTHLFGIRSMPREAFIDFLHGQEGLKVSRELMGEWIDSLECYEPENEFILVGPMKESEYGNLKSVTFLVNPDQLALLVYAAEYHAAPGDPAPIRAPFDSGCGQLLPAFDDLSVPQAVIGGTDVAMRQYLPPDILAFTVTKPMFERICSLDRDSFLYKPFWKDLVKARDGKH